MYCINDTNCFTLTRGDTFEFPIVINKEFLYGKCIKRINIIDLPGIAESLEANILYTDYYNKYIKKERN